MTSQGGTLKHYVTGIVFCLLFTFIAFLLVAKHILAGTALVITLCFLALLQLVAQLHYFVNLGNENKPRWNVVVFLFMLGVAIIIVGGSLWIMHNLNYTVMPSMSH